MDPPRSSSRRSHPVQHSTTHTHAAAAEDAFQHGEHSMCVCPDMAQSVDKHGRPTESGSGSGCECTWRRSVRDIMVAGFTSIDTVSIGKGYGTADACGAWLKAMGTFMSITGISRALRDGPRVRSTSWVTDGGWQCFQKPSWHVSCEVCVTADAWTCTKG